MDGWVHARINGVGRMNGLLSTFPHAKKVTYGRRATLKGVSTPTGKAG